MTTNCTTCQGKGGFSTVIDGQEETTNCPECNPYTDIDTRTPDQKIAALALELEFTNNKLNKLVKEVDLLEEKLYRMHDKVKVAFNIIDNEIEDIKGEL